ncbi:MAG TPA: EscU/YscU/HrcU family type III secretion system export apparatus switch protein [Terriglobales bacterium]|nr:EscU/YscU/HrcU family type III secretion system export apparatus switch protein [Terriglobales bacterium]
MADSNRTEPGTAHKREEARKKGSIARGRDLPGATAMVIAIAMLSWFAADGVAQWRHLLAELLDDAARPGGHVGLAQLRTTFLLALGWTGVVAASAWVGCTAIAFQGGFVISPGALLRFSRLQPAQNVKKLFSPEALSRTAKTIFPVLVIAYLTYGVVSSNWGQIVRASDFTVAAALAWLMQTMLAVAWRGAMVLLAWSGVDYLLQRRAHENSLKMTKQEVKEDTKQTQGSPETRGRIRRIQRQMYRRRMMQAVPTATVVVTNPTHYAVALQYDPLTMLAPVVVAKGREQVAARIRALAVASGVPVVENRAVARALYSSVELGAPIPGKLYAAVAEILAFLRRAQAKRTAMAPLWG